MKGSKKTVRICIAALFLLLDAGVALIQDNRFFGSAPKEVRDVIREKPERFPGAHLLGWILGAAAILIFIAAFAAGMIEGGRSGFTFTRYAVRFAVMLYLLKAFDIIVFDRILLCGGRFFPRYYPECAPVLGKHLFGFNKKTHIAHLVIIIPLSLLLAWIAVMIF